MGASLDLFVAINLNWSISLNPALTLPARIGVLFNGIDVLTFTFLETVSLPSTGTAATSAVEALLLREFDQLARLDGVLTFKGGNS